MYQELLQRLLHRPENANKYDFGHVLVIGGSPGTVGAPLLAAMAALRVGAGLVTVASHAEVIDRVEERVLEAMTLRISHDAPAAVQQITDFIAAKKVNALIVGPGLQAPLADLTPNLLPALHIPVVLDAGALAALQGDAVALELLGARNPGIILTPHDGEYRRLTGVALPTELSAREQAAVDFATTTHVTLVCKGHHSIVAHPDGTAYQDLCGNPGLATAGTGDVLSGVIGGLLAQGVAPAQAADLGVHLHAVAGDLAAAAMTQPSVIASDVVERIPDALRQASADNDR